VRVDAGHPPARDPEVKHLHHHVLAHHDILGLDITVDDAPTVRTRECAGDIRELGDACRDQYGGVADDVTQRAAFDELHHDERYAILRARIEDPDRVRVVDGGGSARLADDTCRPRRRLARSP
jgi:hypothetical protein